jgi:hypothetical protein
MSDESTETTNDIAELAQLDRDLGAAVRTKPQAVRLVNSEPLPVGAIIPDPNKTRAEIEHPSPVLDRLRAAIANPETSEQDRASARECLRIAFHE